MDIGLQVCIRLTDRGAMPGWLLPTHITTPGIGVIRTVPNPFVRALPTLAPRPALLKQANSPAFHNTYSGALSANAWNQ